MNNRRQFIKMMVGFVSGAGLLFSPLTNGVRVVLAKAKKMILPKGTRMDSLVGKNPANLDTRNLDLTPLEKFETMGLDDHQIDLKKWQLEIGGHVQRPLELTYDQMVHKPSIERDVLLICPGIFAYHARWKGISVAKLLETAGVDSGATHITFSGPEGTYEKTERFPIEDILSDKVFLAYGANDSVLAKKHGFPLRVVAEGYYGDEWVKYVYKVTVNKS
ncbi:MAG: molybdopterin-dependent oxidoreductase [Desulfobacterales bacterium]|nr:molybdopterin-dependent oxidoreductase [Deltaproteobacteria bacterium]NNL76177.1 molybdopterin-dependent oxidoreductase [Desulfobacterales bacterium]